eukprot:5714047-Pleurochrysis_carterae.AAC.1
MGKIFLRVDLIGVASLLTLVILPADTGREGLTPSSEREDRGRSSYSSSTHRLGGGPRGNIWLNT